MMPGETRPEPEVGEVRRFTEIDWQPWCIITSLYWSEFDERRAEFALLDQTDDDVIETVPDATVATVVDTVGDRLARKEVAAAIRANDDIDKLTAPVRRFAVLGESGVQSCAPLTDR